MKSKNGKTNCEFCSHYAYDEEYQCNYCQINLDEDEMEKFMHQSMDSCHYFQLYNEYKMVEKQN